jgi:hypothetical protein
MLKEGQPQTIRPYGDKCKNCPLSQESTNVSRDFLATTSPKSRIESIRQFCNWDNWRNHTAVVTVEMVVEGERAFHTFSAKDVVGEAPENCPLPR